MTSKMLETNKATVARFLAGTHSPNIDDVDVIDATVARHFRGHGFPGFPQGEVQGCEHYKAFFRQFRQSFSDMQLETLATLAAADFVSVHWQVHATHTGAFDGIAPDGARVMFDGAALYRMENGRIAETWLTLHEPLLRAQLGRQQTKAAAAREGQSEAFA